jgi:hypothetical protein
MGLILIWIVLVHLMMVLHLRILAGQIANGFGSMRRLSWIRTRFHGSMLLFGHPITHLHRLRNPHITIGWERLADCEVGWAAMVYVGKLCPVSAGNMLVLKLRPHRFGMHLVACR